MEELRSVNYPDRRINTGEENGQTIGMIVPVGSGNARIAPVSGILQPGDGIEPGGFDYDLISFQEVDDNGDPVTPARYLRAHVASPQQQGRLVLEELPTSQQEQKTFRKEATFEQVPPLFTPPNGDTDGMYSYKSITLGPPTLNEGFFVRHYGFRLMVTDSSLNPPLFAKDATFKYVS
jgi:hypothetical protein